MKSCWISIQNGRAGIEFRDVPVPQPRAGEILLRVHATSLNRGEFKAWNQADGQRPGGVEAAGIVHAVGSGVEGREPGERIMARAKGGFAEYALLDAHQAIPVPERFTWEQAAAVPLVYLIAYDMLYPYGKLKRGEWLLVTAASSGVGVACLQAGKHLGAKVIGTSGSADKLARLEDLGLDVGILTRSGDFAAQVRAATAGKGADVIVNNVGGSVFAECMRALARHGRLAMVGTLDGVAKSEIDVEALHTNRLQVFGVSNKFTTAAQRAGTVRGFIRKLLPAFAAGHISPVIDKVFAFDQMREAHAYMESDAQVGKIVVRVPQQPVGLRVPTGC